MKRKKRLVENAEFNLGRDESLVISIGSSFGIDRVIVENKDGETQVRATGHTRFELARGKDDPGQCDFWLGNPPLKTRVEDYLSARFWGQFNWSELFAADESPTFKKRVKKTISKLAEEFEIDVAERLNQLRKGYQRSKRKRKKQKKTPAL